MTIIDIFSGFLGAGKTTLIRKLIKEGYKGEKLVLIENDFGEISIDGGFLRDAGVEITEMSSGCICCSLVGDFREALKKVIDDFDPDRIIIEPSGVGKLSDVATAVEQVEGVQIGAKVTVVDAGKCRMYMRNFGEFFNNQVENADIIVMSRTDTAKEDTIVKATELLKGLNDKVSLISTPWDKLTGEQILSAMRSNGISSQIEVMEHEHHHHHHEHGEECTCGCHDHEHHHHHHEHGEECTCGCHDHEHHHHEHGEECACGCHDHEHHHHEHGEECACGCHDHEHHHHEHGEECSCGCHGHHHHAEEVFESWGMETPKKFSAEQVKHILTELDNNEKYGMVLRAKGFVDSDSGDWIYFDYVPGEANVSRGGAAVTGRFCVIGSKMNMQALKELFELG